MRLGLVWLLQDDVAGACVRLARGLVADRQARVVVGDVAIPHVTLVHVETEADPETAWREARASLPARAQVDILALALLRYDVPYNAPRAPPGTMAWLILPASAALRRAEEAALGLGFVRSAEVTTSNGDSFQPHVTLAIWDGELAPGSHALPADLVGRTGVTGRLALGVIGPNGALTRTLFEA